MRFLKNISQLAILVAGLAMFCLGCAVDQYGRPVVVIPGSSYPAPGYYEVGPDVRLVPRTYYYLDDYYGGYVVVNGLFPLGYVYPGWYVGLPPYGYPVIGRVHGGWDRVRNTVIVNNVTVSNPNIPRNAFNQHVRERFHAPPASSVRSDGIIPGHPHPLTRQQAGPVTRPSDSPQNAARGSMSGTKSQPQMMQPQLRPQQQFHLAPASRPQLQARPAPAPASNRGGGGQYQQYHR